MTQLLVQASGDSSSSDNQRTAIVRIEAMFEIALFSRAHTRRIFFNYEKQLYTKRDLSLLVSIVVVIVAIPFKVPPYFLKR